MSCVKARDPSFHRDLLAECAADPGVEGKEELNIITEDVKCYEDVSAIDWSQY
ncbi:hypothetical protein LQW54_010980 [Pestalotiopsis sp. IQ-011]